MRLCFCEWPVLEPWVCCEVARKLNRSLLHARKREIARQHAQVEAVRTKGLKLAVTMNGAAALLLTSLYKGSPPIQGDAESFPLRKQFARAIASEINERIEMIR